MRWFKLASLILFSSNCNKRNAACDLSVAGADFDCLPKESINPKFRLDFFNELLLSIKPINGAILPH